MIWILLESFICIQLLFFQKLMICQNKFQSSISGIKNDEITFDSIHVSSSKPARLVAEHLISLGHRKITYISTPISDIERSRSNVTMHLLQLSKNTALEMTASVFVPSHPESIICCLQICWNILPDTI